MSAVSEGRVRILKKILFVCSGNTCRSPLAEGIAKKVFADSKTHRVASAGTSALDGLPASPPAANVAEKNSIDLSSHLARLLSGALVKEADLIIALASKHRETVGIIDPAALEYTYLLTDFCEDVEGDVTDPIGMGLEEYEKTFETIERCVRGLTMNIDKFEGWKR